MVENSHPPGPATLLRRIAATGLGVLQNRSDLLIVELQEEKARLVELLVWTIGLLFLGIMAMLMLTGTIIFLFAEEYRVYLAAGFAVLYLMGAVAVALTVKSLLKKAPLPETAAQVKKDREWLESLQ